MSGVSDRLFEVRALCDALNARARTLGPMLLPNGRIDGHHLKTFNVEDRPRRKDGGRSLVLDLSGPKQGHWRDYGGAGPGEQFGDMMDLVRIVKCGGDQARAIQWARIELGMASGDRRAHERAQAKRDAQAREWDARVEADNQRRRDKAKALFLNAIPLAHRDAAPVVEYLRNRAIDLVKLGRAPGALRYDPACWNRETRGPLPAMIASIHDLTGEIMAVHRTYLACEDGRWVKHPRLIDAKLTLGPSLGGHIPLWKGADRAPLKDIADDSDFYVSEGIEDGLSVAMAAPDRRVIAAVSLSKLYALRLPPQTGSLIVIAQNDGHDAKAVDALEAGIGAQQAAGRRVQSIWPPMPHKDFNDWLRADPVRAMGRQGVAA
jgi:hypothetical protein